MNLALLLKPLMELEYQMHRLYMWYSDMFDGDLQVKNLFRQMAREELKHRDSVQNQFQLVVTDLSAYDSVKADLDGLLQLTSVLNRQIDDRQPMSLDEALSAAIQLEKTAAESHYRFLIAKANPVLKELVFELAKGDKEHLLRLESFHRSLDRT